MSGNKIGEEGAKALGPHLAKLSNMTTLLLHSAWYMWYIVSWVFFQVARCEY